MQDEIQARYQGQIVELQSELEKKNQFIENLQKELENEMSRRPVLISPPQVRMKEQVMINKGAPGQSVSFDDELDDESVVRYFARSSSGGSMLQRSPPSPFDCPSVDAMLLDFTSEETVSAMPPQTVLNPQPLWQLEFGSAWERIQKNVIRQHSTPMTSNPRDLVIDFGDDSSSQDQTETEDDDNVFYSPVPTSSRNPFRKSFTVSNISFFLNLNIKILMLK